MLSCLAKATIALNGCYLVPRTSMKKLAQVKKYCWHHSQTQGKSEKIKMRANSLWQKYCDNLSKLLLIYTDGRLIFMFWSIFSALVEKIYQAQKERDAAMNARLKIAYSEREELLDKLRRTEREHTGYENMLSFFLLILPCRRPLQYFQVPYAELG